MSIMSQTVTFILAGGRANSLSPIMSGKPRTLLPFGGVFLHSGFHPLQLPEFGYRACISADAI